MESRRVKLLTIAYFNGRLDFKKHYQWDKTRENVVLYHIERELLAEVFRTKTLQYAILSTILVQGNPQAIHLSDKPFDDYTRFKLPSSDKRPKIDKVNNNRKAEFDEIMKEHKHLISQAKK